MLGSHVEQRVVYTEMLHHSNLAMKSAASVLPYKDGGGAVL